MNKRLRKLLAAKSANIEALEALSAGADENGLLTDENQTKADDDGEGKQRESCVVRPSCRRSIANPPHAVFRSAAPQLPGIRSSR